MGSGSLNATTVLESKYHDELTREEAIQIATEAITAGIYHDLGSGSNVDFHVFTKGKVERFRNAILNKDLAPMNL
jgi:20S proteasome subunit beta 2